MKILYTANQKPELYNTHTHTHRGRESSNLFFLLYRKNFLRFFLFLCSSPISRLFIFFIIIGEIFFLCLCVCVIYAADSAAKWKCFIRLGIFSHYYLCVCVRACEYLWIQQNGHVTDEKKIKVSFFHVGWLVDKKKLEWNGILDASSSSSSSTSVSMFFSALRGIPNSCVCVYVYVPHPMNVTNNYL